MAEHNLTVTYNPTVKAKDQPEARMLALDPVHPLVIATKKDDGDAASTQTSSPAPPDTPLTPIMGDFFKVRELRCFHRRLSYTQRHLNFLISVV